MPSLVAQRFVKLLMDPVGIHHAPAMAIARLSAEQGNVRFRRYGLMYADPARRFRPECVKAN